MTVSRAPLIAGLAAYGLASLGLGASEPQAVWALMRSRRRRA